MDAFDNPARNGMTGPQRDSASTDSRTGVAAAILLLPRTSPRAHRSYRWRSRHPRPDASGRIILPAGASIDDIRYQGQTCHHLPNGQVFIIRVARSTPSIVLERSVPASTVAQCWKSGELNPKRVAVRRQFADPRSIRTLMRSATAAIYRTRFPAAESAIAAGCDRRRTRNRHVTPDHPPRGRRDRQRQRSRPPARGTSRPAATATRTAKHDRIDRL